VQTARGNVDAALDSYQASLTIAAHLAEADPDNAQWQHGLSVSHEKIGDVQSTSRLCLSDRLGLFDVPGNDVLRRAV